MTLAITGTPGTGKSSVAEALETELPIIHLNKAIEDHHLSAGTDPDRGSVIADLEAVQAWVANQPECVVESHLAHHLQVDQVVVLRCAPQELRRRLEGQGVGEDSIQENVESEQLDVILVEALEKHGPENVYEIDTTDQDIAEVARVVEAVLDGDREPSAGTVSFLDS